MAKIIKLKEPIQFGSETIGVLEFQDMKAKHLRKISAKPSMDDLLNLAGVLCGQPPSVIDELGMEDTQAVMELVGGFF
jgi:hypothetical protein